MSEFTASLEGSGGLLRMSLRPDGVHLLYTCQTGAIAYPLCLFSTGADPRPLHGWQSLYESTSAHETRSSLLIHTAALHTTTSSPRIS